MQKRTFPRITDSEMEGQDSEAQSNSATRSRARTGAQVSRVLIPLFQTAPTFYMISTWCLSLDDWSGCIFILQIALKQGILLSIFFWKTKHALFHFFFTIYLNISHIQNKVQFNFSACPRNMASLEPGKRMKMRLAKNKSESKKRTTLGK